MGDRNLLKINQITFDYRKISFRDTSRSSDPELHSINYEQTPRLVNSAFPHRYLATNINRLSIFHLIVCHIILRHGLVTGQAQDVSSPSESVITLGLALSLGPTYTVEKKEIVILNLRMATDIVEFNNFYTLF